MGRVARAVHYMHVKGGSTSGVRGYTQAMRAFVRVCIGTLCVCMHWCFLTPYHYMFFCECVLFFNQVGMHLVPLGMCICMGLSVCLCVHVCVCVCGMCVHVVSVWHVCVCVCAVHLWVVHQQVVCASWHKISICF